MTTLHIENSLEFRSRFWEYKKKYLWYTGDDFTLMEEIKGTNSLKRPSNLQMLQPELSGTYTPNTVENQSWITV